MVLGKTRVASVLLVAAALALQPSSARSSPEDDARAAFEAYVRLGHQYDPAAADFYSDDATIRNLRRYPTGQTRELGMTGKQYKDLIRAAMPMARARGDKSDYRDCTYRADGGAVRVHCERYSRLKGYASPYRALLKRAPSGEWLIHDEYSESRP